MEERKKEELSMTEAKTKWVSDYINASFTWVKEGNTHPFPNHKFKGASFTELDNGAISVNFLFVREDK